MNEVCTDWEIVVWQTSTTLSLQNLQNDFIDGKNKVDFEFER